MSRLDLIIFGATGFIGKHTLFHMVEFAKKYQVDSWGIAGRSKKKLEDVLVETTQRTQADLSSIKVIIANIEDEKSLQDMCAQTKIVINCCGPYRFYGEPVVKAAIVNKTHYVDVSDEPYFMEVMQLRYDEAAREAGVFVISACGIESLVSDMGVVFLQKHFSGTLNSVRALSVWSVTDEGREKAEGRGTSCYGKWKSLIYRVVDNKKLASLRKQLYSNPLPDLEPKIREVTENGQEEYYFPSSYVDETVVNRSQRYFYEKDKQRPVQFKSYFITTCQFQTWLTIQIYKFIFMLPKFSITRNLMLKYPKFFSSGQVTKEGPTQGLMDNYLIVYILIGEGWDEGLDIETTKPNKEVVLEVCRVNPGYGGTCVALLSAAITILKERKNMPIATGVITPATAFENTDIITKLNENNTVYKIIETNDK